MKAFLLGTVCLSLVPATVQARSSDNSQDGKASAEANLREEPGQGAEVVSSEIVVNARRRSESDLDVPISVVAMGAEQLDTRGVRSLSDIAGVVPGLNIGPNTGSFGGSLTVRGVSAAAQNISSDQSVAINLDGVTLTHGYAVHFAQFDLQQVEILKGPQSLFFGKNTTAGIISVTSADPTDRPYVMGRVGYEFRADELLTEAVISGPLAEGVRGRLAFFRSATDGYFRSQVTTSPLTPKGPSHDRLPNNTDLGVRGTLVLDPTDSLRIKLKGTYFHETGSSSYELQQIYSCPTGRPSLSAPQNLPGVGTCGIGKLVPVSYGFTAAQTGDPRLGDGRPYIDQKQYLASAAIDYNLTDEITLSSLTGYYKLDSAELGSASQGPTPVFDVLNLIHKKDFSTELRMSTNFSGAINGMIGGYYADGTMDMNVPIFFFGPFPYSLHTVYTRTFAGFAQLTVKPVPELEISAGGRYTSERKRLAMWFSPSPGTGAAPIRVDDQLVRNSISLKAFTPELSLSYKPDSRLNVYATYKRGAKSGGFTTVAATFPNATGPNAGTFIGQDLSYGDEKVDGFEAGVKSTLLDGQLRLDLAGYRYKYKKLQVSSFNPYTFGLTTRNADDPATIEGVELSLNYTSRAVPGLSLAAALNYNHARYGKFLADCYPGQNPSEGCSISRSDGTYAQNLVGRPLLKAPDWSGSVSASYDTPDPVVGPARIGLSVSANYTSSYYPQGEEPPASLQRKYATLDAQLRFMDKNDHWELAIIGRNLTNALRIQNGSSIPLTGTAGGPGSTTDADLFGFSNRPRGIELRLTVKPL